MKERSDPALRLRVFLEKVCQLGTAVDEAREYFDVDAAQRHRSDFDKLASRAAMLAAQMDASDREADPPELAIIGDFSAGKTTIIAKLIGDDVFATGAGPTTSVVTRVRYGATWSFSEQVGDTRESITRQEYIRRSAMVRSTDTRVSFEVTAPVPELRGLCLVDTPGFDNPDRPDDTDVTKEEARRAAAIVYVMDIEKGNLSESGRVLMDELTIADQNQVIYMILSKAFSKTRKERDAVLLENEPLRHGNVWREVQLFDGVNNAVPGAKSDDVLDRRGLWAKLDSFGEGAREARKRRTETETRDTVRVAERIAGDVNRQLIGVEVRANTRAKRIVALSDELAAKIVALNDRLIECLRFAAAGEMDWDCPPVPKNEKDWVFRPYGRIKPKTTECEVQVRSYLVDLLRDEVAMPIVHAKSKGLEIEFDSSGLTQQADRIVVPFGKRLDEIAQGCIGNVKKSKDGVFRSVANAEKLLERDVKPDYGRRVTMDDFAVSAREGKEILDKAADAVRRAGKRAEERSHATIAPIREALNAFTTATKGLTDELRTV